MPLYVIERTFAEKLDLSADDVRLIEGVNADEGVSWLFSFLSADRQRSYCLYEAPSPDAIVAAARRADVPVDSIVEVTKFATFYVTGWFSSPCSGDDPVPDKGYVVGHFIKYIFALNNGGGSGELCDFNSFGSCIAVLTE